MANDIVPVERIKNLGPVSAMISSRTEPSNKKILWYDETVTAGCPIKFYNLTTQDWEPLKDV